MRSPWGSALFPVGAKHPARGFFRPELGSEQVLIQSGHQTSLPPSVPAPATSSFPAGFLAPRPTGEQHPHPGGRVRLLHVSARISRFPPHLPSPTPAHWNMNHSLKRPFRSFPPCPYSHPPPQPGMSSLPFPSKLRASLIFPTEFTRFPFFSTCWLCLLGCNS